MNVAINGINGRMGDYVRGILENRKNFNVICGISPSNNKFSNIKIYNKLENAILNEKIDLLVDFSVEEASYNSIKHCLNNSIKVISGTTGMKDSKIDELKLLGKKMNTSFIYIPNFAQGSSDMFNLIDVIKGKYEKIDLIEIHHKNKLDKPSGTAKEYAKLLNLEESDVESLRINDIIASHELVLSSTGEKLVIRHEINHRDAFLKGFLNLLDIISKHKFVSIVGLKEYYEIKPQI